jgi:hypothetical protein
MTTTANSSKLPMPIIWTSKAGLTATPKNGFFDVLKDACDTWLAIAS